MLDRRDFLRIAVASLPLPFLRVGENKVQSFLISRDGNYLPVNDPVAWALNNARQPILERASEGLLKLSSLDGTRVIRLMTRRCGLNVIEVQHEQVVVHYWGRCGQVDLRLFFHHHELARPEIEVVALERKRGISTTRPGDDFLYGDRLPDSWPLPQYVQRWERRFLPEQDDWTPAPYTWSGFTWNGIESGRIPWAAMKSAWRRATPSSCLNCTLPTILVNFGDVQAGMLNRVSRFIHVCRNCHRIFGDYSIPHYEVNQWIVQNLDQRLWPHHRLIWNNLVKWEPTPQEPVGGWIEGHPR